MFAGFSFTEREDSLTLWIDESLEDLSNRPADEHLGSNSKRPLTPTGNTDSGARRDPYRSPRMAVPCSRPFRRAGSARSPAGSTPGSPQRAFMRSGQRKLKFNESLPAEKKRRTEHQGVTGACGSNSFTGGLAFGNRRRLVGVLEVAQSQDQQLDGDPAPSSNVAVARRGCFGSSHRSRPVRYRRRYCYP